MTNGSPQSLATKIGEGATPARVRIVLAVLLGILLFHERPHSDPLSLALTGVSSALMLAGIVALARAPAPKARAGAP